MTDKVAGLSEDLGQQQQSMLNEPFVIRAHEFFLLIRDVLGRDSEKWDRFKDLCNSGKENCKK